MRADFLHSRAKWQPRRITLTEALIAVLTAFRSAFGLAGLGCYVGRADAFSLPDMMRANTTVAIGNLRGYDERALTSREPPILQRRRSEYAKFRIIYNVQVMT
jgi:hypothetical protein